jgi:hypothetical protein
MVLVQTIYLGMEPADLCPAPDAQRFRQGFWRWGDVERPWDFRRNQRNAS